jgi:hypothetical protein
MIDLMSRVRSFFGMRVQGVIAYAHDLRDAPSTDALAIRTLSPADLPLLAAMHPIDHAEIRSRLARGDTCYLAFQGDRLCHFSWVQVTGLHVIGDVGRCETVAPGELWIYHCRTSDWARGRRIYPRVLAHIVATHRDRGFSCARIYTTLDNTASQRGITWAGFRPRELWCAARIGPVLQPFPSLQWS